MATRKSRLRKAGRLVLAAFVFFLLGVFLLFRPVLILPSRVESRISLDYKPPYPSKIELPIEVPVTISPGQFGMPDEHWGERRVHMERAQTEDAPEDGFVPRPTYRRLTYYGGKLTEEVELVKRDRTAPWNNVWAPWKPADFGFGGGYSPFGFPGGQRDTRPVQLWVKCTIQQAPRWLCAWGFVWTKEPVHRTRYAYDAEGRLVEQWDENLSASDVDTYMVGPSLGYEEAGVRTTRTVHDDKGDKIGELSYEYGAIVRGELEVRDATAEIKDVYSIRGREDGYEIVCRRGPTSWRVLQEGLTTWWAEYDMHGRLRNDERGVAGTGIFRKAGQTVSVSVHFDETAKVVEDGEGAAAHRNCWNESGTWDVRAYYDASGRLTDAGYLGAVSQYRVNKLLPFATQSYYKPNRWISHLYFDTYPVGRFGWLRTVRLVALLAAGPAFGITLVCLLDRLRGRRKRRLA